jgi:hypothetical protein
MRLSDRHRTIIRVRYAIDATSVPVFLCQFMLCSPWKRLASISYGHIGTDFTFTSGVLCGRLKNRSIT